MSEAVPPWLAAWRAGQPAEEPASLSPAPPPATVSAPAPRVVHPMSRGFTEPTPWKFDECTRRDAVLDHDHHPPRVVRRVGWQRCMRCRKPFWSEDVIRLRLCGAEHMGCRGDEDRFN